MLKASQLKFNIPVRMYDPAVTEDVNTRPDEDEGVYRLTGNKASSEPHRFIVDYAAIPLQDIQFWAATFYRGDDFDIVYRDGADATMVSLRTGENFFCHWPKKKFEQEYDLHVEKMDKLIQEEEGFDILEINEDNFKDIEAAIKDYKKQKKLQTIKTNE